MPQLQPADFAPQLVWLAITFAVLYFTLSSLIIPRIGQALEARKSALDGDLAKARAARQQAEEENARYEAGLASARAKAQATLRTAREKIEAEAGDKRAKLDAQLSAKAAEAHKKVVAIQEQAAAQMQTITADVVGEIVKELAGVEVNDEEIRQALSKSTKE